MLHAPGYMKLLTLTSIALDRCVYVRILKANHDSITICFKFGFVQHYNCRQKSWHCSGPRSCSSSSLTLSILMSSFFFSIHSRLVKVDLRKSLQMVVLSSLLQQNQNSRPTSRGGSSTDRQFGQVQLDWPENAPCIEFWDKCSPRDVLTAFDGHLKTAKS